MPAAICWRASHSHPAASPRFRSAWRCRRRELDPRGAGRCRRARTAVRCVAPRRRASTGARRTRDPRGAGRARTRAGGPLHLGGDSAADAPGLRGGRGVSRVTAVVVHWRDAEDTRGCLESLAAEPGLDVVVVDNGARPPLGALAAPVVCLRSEENLGYAGGANLGIAAALERGADTVLLLNNDARVLPGATAAAVRVLASDPRVAVVGPKVLAREDPSRLWLA